MNNIDSTEATEEGTTMSVFSVFLDYALNKYMPLAIVCFICFYTLGFSAWEPYFIVGLMIFSNGYNFKCGYAHSCLDNGLKDDTDDTDDTL